MKRFLTIALIVICIFFVSCKKQTTQTTPAVVTTIQKGITYPDSMYYGKNILTMPDSTLLDRFQNYDFAAILEKDANLSIIITNFNTTPDSSGYFPTWYYGGNLGWAVLPFTPNNTQRFLSNQTGKLDLWISFNPYGQIGKCKIDFYENSSTITKTKYIKWW